MGAMPFYGTVGEGKTVHDAFVNAVEQAAYWNGHGGYTGTIAEKDSWIEFPGVFTYDEAEELAAKLIEDDDPRISDKWGPAGALQLTDGAWWFFGWASS